MKNMHTEDEGGGGGGWKDSLFRQKFVQVQLSKETNLFCWFLDRLVSRQVL